MKAKSKPTRKGVIAGGNWIIDQVKVIDRFPARESLANIRSQHQGSGGAAYNVLLDLAKHKFARAHDLYGDRWLGFAESDLQAWLEAAGFKKIEVHVVAREEEPPHFETILAGGQK